MFENVSNPEGVVSSFTLSICIIIFNSLNLPENNNNLRKC